jgi:hypothetical protein
MAAGERLCASQRWGAHSACGGGDNSSQVVQPHAESTQRRVWVVGEHVAAVRARATVERKAGRRHGREGGMREPWRSRSRSGCVIFFKSTVTGRRAEGACRNDIFWTSGSPIGVSGADGRLTPNLVDKT